MWGSHRAASSRICTTAVGIHLGQKTKRCRFLSIRSVCFAPRRIRTLMLHSHMYYPDVTCSWVNGMTEKINHTLTDSSRLDHLSAFASQNKPRFKWKKRASSSRRHRDRLFNPHLGNADIVKNNTLPRKFRLYRSPLVQRKKMPNSSPVSALHYHTCTPMHHVQICCQPRERETLGCGEKCPVSPSSNMDRERKKSKQAVNPERHPSERMKST